MKKLFTLLTMLIIGISGMWAADAFEVSDPVQVTDLSSLKDDEYYILQNVGSQLYNYYDSQNSQLDARSTYDYSSVVQLLYNSSTGNVQIKHVQTNSYYQALSKQQRVSLGSSAVNYSFNTDGVASGQFRFCNNSFYMNRYGGGSQYPMGAETKYAGDYSKWKIYKVTVNFNMPVSFPDSKYISVGEKVSSITGTTTASDNDHWYLITQTRGGESVIYDSSTDNVKRASTDFKASYFNLKPLSDNVRYLVRFIPAGGDDLYYIQFGSGRYVAGYGGIPADMAVLKPSMTAAGKYAFYNCNNNSGSYFGWNLGSKNGKIVDNNGAGNTVSYWGSGTVSGTSGNNVWTVYPVEFVSTVEISYTLTDENGATYNGTYNAKWDGDNTAEPSIPGAYGATFSNKVFSDEGGYSLTAVIDFGFPVSSKGVNNPTAIQSALGESLWYAKDGKVIADDKANTTVYNVKADYYRWYIYPILDNGEFYFALYNVGARKYIPNNPSTDSNIATTLTDVQTNVGGFQFAHYKQGNGFYDKSSSKFLTINTSGTAQNIWLWTAGATATHMGSVMSFPELTIVSVSDAFNALKGATKFDILEGSTVMGPSEFDAPESINEAIDAAQDVEANDDAKIAFIESDNGKMIKKYLNQVAKIGALANIQFTMSKEYGTLILPCPCTRIDGLDIYSCSGKEDNTLTLTPVGGNYVQNKPYIIHATEGNKYTIIGWNKGSTGTHPEGWLTGVLNSTTDIPVGSYMLATNKTTKVQAFYKVTGSGVKCAINKCYLTVPSASDARTLYLDVDGEITAIEEVFGEETEQGAIYNLAGQRLTKAQKGINIINGKKVIK